MGKSIPDVAQALRISARYLRGIEEGNYDGWPERVFSSGFIRSYAKYLSMDPTSVLAEYERSLQAVSVEEPAPQQARPEWLERERERGSRRSSYIFAAGIVLLVGVVLAFLTMRRPESPVSPPPVAMAPPAPAADNAAPPVDNATAAADNAAASGVPAAEGVATDNAAPASTLSAVGGGGPLTGPFQLFLEASAHTWVMYSFDDGDPIDVTLYVGDKISIQAKRRITLKIGNAGGVVGTLNGQRLPPFGESGQVRNIAFGQ
jgi:hypothetical protein